MAAELGFFFLSFLNLTLSHKYCFNITHAELDVRQSAYAPAKTFQACQLIPGLLRTKILSYFVTFFFNIVTVLFKLDI